MLSDEEREALRNFKSEYETCNHNSSDLIIELDDAKIILNLVEKQSKEIEELKEENLEIRDWKYVIDNPIDLDKLKELDLIKIKGKEYISKSIYNELEKDKKALVNNYSNVLGKFIPKDKIKAKIEEAKKNYNDLHTKHLRDCGIAEQRELAKIEFGQSLLEKE